MLYHFNRRKTAMQGDSYVQKAESPFTQIVDGVFK